MQTRCISGCVVKLMVIIGVVMVLVIVVKVVVTVVHVWSPPDGTAGKYT